MLLLSSTSAGVASTGAPARSLLGRNAYCGHLLPLLPTNRLSSSSRFSKASCSKWLEAAVDPAVTYGDGNSSSSSSAAAAAAKGWTDTAAEALKAGKLAQIQLPPALLRELPLSPAVPVVGASQEASVEALQATGRWGEAVVCQYLRLQAASARSLLVVDWVNETGESRLPYDIRVHDVEEGEVYYVEVKATRAESKTFFEVSPAELAFCQQQGDRHHVYRLTGAAGSSAAPPQIVLRLVNPAELRAQHIINVCIVL